MLRVLGRSYGGGRSLMSESPLRKHAPGSAPPPAGTVGPLSSEVVHRVSSSLLGPVDISFRALSGRLDFTVRRHKFNTDSLCLERRGDTLHDFEDSRTAKGPYEGP